MLDIAYSASKSEDETRVRGSSIDRKEGESERERVREKGKAKEMKTETASSCNREVPERFVYYSNMMTITHIHVRARGAVCNARLSVPPESLIVI